MLWWKSKKKMSPVEECALVVSMSNEEIIILKLLMKHKAMSFLQIEALAELDSIEMEKEKIKEIIELFYDLDFVIIKFAKDADDDIITLREKFMRLAEWIPFRDVFALKEVKAPSP